MSVGAATLAGLKAVARRPSLVALLLAFNLLAAALLAVPLVGVLEDGLQHSDAAGQMLYGFDYAWWTAWHTGKSDWTASFQPDLFGAGFAVKNVDLLLRGSLPGRAFESLEDSWNDFPAPPLVLGLGLAYMLLQVFLGGGVLAVLRGGQAGLPWRGLFHGAGFYFGRLLRVAALALLADWVLFRLNGPFAAWAEGRAREAVSEDTALVWLFGRHALLLLGILAVHLLSCYAKLIVVLEERRSALLAFLSAIGFCFRNLRRAFGHLLAVALLGVLLVALWSVLDGAWHTTGYKTQLVSLALSQALVFGLIGLRLSLYAGQIALYRALPKGP